MQLVNVQHGFRRGRSTNSNLLCFLSYAAQALDDEVGGQVDVAYLDFKKAFVSVDNDILLMKFAMVGFTPLLLSFFGSYLRNRRQYVEYAGYVSREYLTLTGVSQGSNLGPLEFLIMINDLPDVICDSQCLLFADDIKLFLAVKDIQDCEKLQQDIDRGWLDTISWKSDGI